MAYSGSYNSRFKRPHSYSNNRFAPKRRQNDGFVLEKIDWRKLKLAPFQKDFYFEHPEVTERSTGETQKILKENEITIYGNAPKPINTFRESGLPPYIMKSIDKLKFEHPTPIQRQSWPIALSGRDMIGIAATGSGKTLAFLVPLIVHINAQKPLSKGDGPLVVIVAPTRELATQIMGQIPNFAESSRIRYTSIYGGVPKHSQEKQLSRGVEIIVATPGRLLDFLQSKVTNLKRVTYLVLDEADRMLDMGFEKPIRQILSQIRPERQTLLFSATWPKEIQKLASEILNNPVHVNIGALDISSCKNVKQDFEVVEEYNKQMKLLLYLRQLPPRDKVLVFVATKAMSNQLAQNLKTNGFYCAAINGDKRQSQREFILSKFRNGEISILIGTDVASRGIDIRDIRVVINFDFPNTIEDYVHRVGRTGRADKQGRSYTLLTRKNANKSGDLIRLLKNDKKKIPPDIERLYNNYGVNARSNNSHYRKWR
ncbi:hypothetical protein MHBO_000610 [Bonamia ostreae]|uniref:RNA helicase n=1 Tax=Bonamia ostreae TaxID=126728 RepID=A0ABV2AG63_9EUKA